MLETGPNNALRQPVVSILLTLLIFFVGFQAIGPFIGGLIALPLYPGSELEFREALKNPFSEPSFRIILLIMQGTGVLIGMVLLPYYFLKKQHRSLGELFHTPALLPSLIIATLVIVFMGVNQVFIKWNQEIILPFGMENWARPMEQKLAEGTIFLTQIESTTQMILAFLVIAILPAIGEEIVFRGMIQNDFYRGTGNIHLSIWISAIIFSAVHVQFYGFFPRMFLGALFGYLYFWSGNLWMPVLAHFVNNAFALSTMVLFQKGEIPDLEKVEVTPFQVIISALLSGVLLYGYKNFYNKQPKIEIPD